MADSRLFSAITEVSHSAGLRLPWRNLVQERLRYIRNDQRRFRRKKRLKNVCSRLRVRKVIHEMPAMFTRSGSQISGL